MHLLRDLLDQMLSDPRGDPAGRADDFLIRVDEDGIFIDMILSGGGILADDLGLIGRGTERLCHLFRRRPLRRAGIPWSSVTEVAEHALTVAGTRRDAPISEAASAVRLRATRRLPAHSLDGVPLHLVDMQATDPEPRARLRVTGLIVRRRHRVAWPVSLRPRQRAAARDWRFVPSDRIRLTATEIVVDLAFDSLSPIRETKAFRPPARAPRTDP
jgi:hypothetical protein